MKSKRHWFGVSVSIAWLAFCGWLIYIRWCDVKTMPLNEYGDFMAGAFAPLAFLWLVLGYLQQGEELKLSTDALHLQANELANSVQQQQALVEVSRQQVAAAREAMEFEKLEKERDAEPIIRVSNSGASNNGERFEYMLRIENAGAMVTDVKIYFQHGAEESLFVKTIPVLTTAKTEVIQVVLQGHPINSDSQLKAEYVKRNGKSGTSISWIRPRVQNGARYLAFD